MPSLAIVFYFGSDNTKQYTRVLPGFRFWYSRDNRIVNSPATAKSMVSDDLALKGSYRFVFELEYNSAVALRI